MRLRAFELARAGYGAGLVLRPELFLGLLRVPVDGPSVWVTRLLGARHLVQAVVTVVTPGGLAMHRELGAGVDALHAATAAGLAAVDRDRARAGLLDAGVAGTWAWLGWREARRRPSGR